MLWAARVPGPIHVDLCDGQHLAGQIRLRSSKCLTRVVQAYREANLTALVDTHASYDNHVCHTTVCQAFMILLMRLLLVRGGHVLMRPLPSASMQPCRSGQLRNFCFQIPRGDLHGIICNASQISSSVS